MVKWQLKIFSKVSNGINLVDIEELITISQKENNFFEIHSTKDSTFREWWFPSYASARKHLREYYGIEGRFKKI